MGRINKGYRLRVRTGIKELKRIEMVRPLTHFERSMLRQFERIILG